MFPRLFKVSVQSLREDPEILLPRLSPQTERDDILTREMETARAELPTAAGAVGSTRRPVSWPADWRCAKEKPCETRTSVGEFPAQPRHGMWQIIPPRILP